MDILRNYKHFINESLDIKTLADVPNEVMESAKKIAGDIFDRVRKPTFELLPEGLVLKFFVTGQDFNFADNTEQLTLDLTEGARKKRNYNVTLTYLEGVSETFELTYLVTFEEYSGQQPIETIEDEDEDDNYDAKRSIAQYQGKNDDDDYFDEDMADQQIKKGNIKLKDYDIEDEIEEED